MAIEYNNIDVFIYYEVNTDFKTRDIQLHTNIQKTAVPEV